MFEKLKFNIDKIILVILIVLMILPYSIKFFGIGISHITTVLIALIFFYLILTRRDEMMKILKNKFIIFNLLFSLIIICSLIINFKTVMFNDIYEPIKYIVFAMITSIILVICQKKENYLFFLKVINIVIIIITVFGIIQYFNPFSINEYYLNFYTTEPHYKTLINDYSNPRIIGTKWTPPAWGLLVSFGVYFNILNLKYNKSKVLSLLAIVLCITNLMMTLTRANQIAFIISLIIFILINVWQKKGWKKAIIAMSATILIIFILLMILPEKLTWRLMQITDLSKVNSWMIRTNKWDEQLGLLQGNQLFGIGPIKNKIESIGYTDSELIQIIMQYGIVGSIAYIIMLFIPIYEYVKNKNLKDLLLFYPSILTLIIIHNTSASSLIFFDTAIGIYIMIGILLNNFKEKKINE